MPCSDPEARRLGNWLNRQFTRKRLNKDQRDQLDRLRPHLQYSSIEEKKETSWNFFFNMLVEYKKSHHTVLIQKKDTKHRKLHDWKARQLSLHRQGKLSPERTEALASIGVDFSYSKNPKDSEERNYTAKQIKDWDDMFKRLFVFYERNGHCKVPYTYDDQRLGRWVAKQRVRFHNGDLDIARRDRLNKLGFVWKVHKKNG